MVQNYICFRAPAINGYELYSTLHHKKREMLLSKKSITALTDKQKG